MSLHVKNDRHNLDATPASPQAGLPSMEKHCIFRCGDAWFSVPAVAVRQVVVTPDIVAIPHCHPALIGVGRVRGEFVPAVELLRLLEVSHAPAAVDHACLLVFEGSCQWSLLISESIALEPIETIAAQAGRADQLHNAIIGTAIYRDQIVRVLNPSRLLALVQSSFESYWSHPQERVGTYLPSAEMSLL